MKRTEEMKKVKIDSRGTSCYSSQDHDNPKWVQCSTLEASFPGIGVVVPFIAEEFWQGKLRINGICFFSQHSTYQKTLMDGHLSPYPTHWKRDMYRLAGDKEREVRSPTLIGQKLRAHNRPTRTHAKNFILNWCFLVTLCIIVIVFFFFPSLPLFVHFLVCL